MIWKRYLIREVAKIFFLFIGGLSFLYILIDYAAHTKSFFQEGIRLIDIFLYYLFELANRADILIPIALLISTVKVLTTCNVRNEIVALASAGVPLKTMLRPILLIGVICGALLYLNFQFLQPLSLVSLEKFEERYFKERTDTLPIGALSLADDSLLLYQKFDSEKEAFFDVYWYKNSETLYRIHHLYPYKEIPFGEHVDLLTQENGMFKRTAFYETLPIEGIHFDRRSLFTAVHPPRSQSLTQLWTNLKWGKRLTDREAEVATIFFYKMAIPLAALLVILAPAPFCLRFSRQVPIFMIFVLSLFGLITFFTFVNACVILGESQVLSPLWAIALPFFLFFGLFGWRYIVD